MKGQTKQDLGHHKDPVVPLSFSLSLHPWDRVGGDSGLVPRQGASNLKTNPYWSEDGKLLLAPTAPKLLTLAHY